jgi:hypothetical protein
MGGAHLCADDCRYRDETWPATSWSRISWRSSKDEGGLRSSQCGSPRFRAANEVIGRIPEKGFLTAGKTALGISSTIWGMTGSQTRYKRLQSRGCLGSLAHGLSPFEQLHRQTMRPVILALAMNPAQAGTQCPLSTSVLMGSIKTWTRNSIACTKPTASTACNTKPLNAPVSLAAIRSWLLV